MSCHSETGRVGIRRCIEINQRLHFRFTLPYQNRYFDTRPSPVGEVIRLPDLSCVETNCDPAMRKGKGEHIKVFSVLSNTLYYEVREA